MKKLLFLSSFLLGMVSLSSAQEVKSSAGNNLPKADLTKNNLFKKMTANKPTINIIMGEDQIASEAVILKQKQPAAKQVQ